MNEAKQATDTFTPTRFPCVGYRKTTPYVGASTWSFVDAASGAQIGPKFPRKSELLAALADFAAEYGCNGCVHPEITERLRETGKA